MTPRLFAQALLARLGLPYTPNNLAALVSAQAIEGGAMYNAAAHNPLNTTLRRPGSKSVTPVGVQAYPTWADGLAATADTLTSGRYNDILQALKNDEDPDVTLGQAGWETWGWSSPVRPAASYAFYSEKVFPEPRETGRGALVAAVALAASLAWYWKHRGVK